MLLFIVCLFTTGGVMGQQHQQFVVDATCGQCNGQVPYFGNYFFQQPDDWYFELGMPGVGINYGNGSGGFSGLCPGTYQIWATYFDYSDIRFLGNITVGNNLAGPQLTATHTDATGTSNGTITVSATGGSGSYTETGSFTGLAPGPHTYTVTDGNGCSQNITETVAGVITPIPTLSEWGLISLTILVLGFGVFSIRNKIV